LTTSSLERLAAALKAGNYRTGAAYLQIAKKAHIVAGHDWNAALSICLKDSERSITRGIGPPTHAKDFALEDLAAAKMKLGKVIKGSPVCPIDVGICMSLWMLRGIEAASLLGEQMTIDKARTVAVLNLGPTKEDVKGRGCRRTLVCACSKTAEVTMNICPVHAMSRILEKRDELGLTPKHPLFPSKKGRASTVQGVCRTYSMILGTRLTEHSFRRAGAQYYAKRGIGIGLIQFIGRWGGETIYRYIGEALDTVAMNAAKLAASGSLGVSCSPDVASRLSTAKAIMKELDTGAENAAAADAIVKRAVEAAQAAIEQSCLALEMKLTTAALEGLGAVRAVGRAASRSHVHKIALGDGLYPTELWTTACGWRFGAGPHVRLNINEITCASCIKFTSVA
jgi:hypothetical protein